MNWRPCVRRWANDATIAIPTRTDAAIRIHDAVRQAEHEASLLFFQVVAWSLAR